MVERIIYYSQVVISDTKRCVVFMPYLIGIKKKETLKENHFTLNILTQKTITLHFVNQVRVNEIDIALKSL